jgi:hypothetical protein
VLFTLAKHQMRSGLSAHVEGICEGIAEVEGDKLGIVLGLVEIEGNELIGWLGPEVGMTDKLGFIVGD